MERDRVAAIVRGSGSAFVFVAMVALSSCATEDEIRFGEPDRAAAGATAGSSGTGLECTPDPDCDVSFANDVYPVLANKAKCGSSGCHLMATNGFQFPNAPVDAREALLAYTYQGSSPYVVPCDAAASKLSCNLRLENDAEGPFGTCGSQMPKALASDSVSDAPLTAEELELVTDWITCGAPAN